ncbi:hypothetical protein [Saccharothrix texasensis]|uniref:Uncharacterized protein n=1 Tax=Saccharothrix texasensis TaxID=103734 RepID=A0A3N1H4P0_9PSEU|nr:hypothetical protein [Saccharothrix texasensis]ROP37451.1 hypothetical protein EDD40_2764 [Saccharothrix texasensis]
MVPHGPDQRERLRCPDCTATADTTGTGPAALTHDHTCPASAVDRAQRADDLRWLRANPGRTRTRPPSTAEKDALRMSTGAPRAVLRDVRVHVRAVGDARMLKFAYREGTIAYSADLPGGVA